MEREEYLEMIDARHSVRAYQERKLAPEAVAKIEEEIGRLNALSGLHIQLIENAEGVLAALGARLAGWKAPPPACIAMVGDAENEQLERDCGYYGEYLALFLQALGLNTCWVGMFNRKAVRAALRPGERLVLVIAVGYGKTQGKPHKSKPLEKLTDVREMPDWFRRGMDCAMKAPTAVNQQKFFVTLAGDDARIDAAGKGPFVKVDLGIVQCHFELGAAR